MFIILNKILIVRCSQTIFLLKLVIDEEINERIWTLYHTFDLQGQIQYTNGNIRVQVITDSLIYFFKFDPITLMPTTENVMQNYMNCSQMLFGKAVRFCITFKQNQKSFDVFTRQCNHDFKIPIGNEYLEGAIGLELQDSDFFLIAHIDEVTIYDVDTMRKVGVLPINLLHASTREPNQVMSMGKRTDEKHIAIITGKKLVMDEDEINQLYVFEMNEDEAQQT